MAADRPTLVARRGPRAFARRVLQTGLLIELALAVGDMLLNHYKVLPSPLRRSVNIAREDSIGTWFAVVQVLAVGVVAWLLYRRAKAADEPPWVARSWAFLCGFFVYMSVDDAAKIHERVGSTFKKGVAFFPSYAWQAIYAPLFGGAALLLLFMAWRVVRQRTARWWIPVGLACYVAAVALDFAEGIDGVHQAWAALLGWKTHTVSHVQKVIEETIEMAGSTFFLGAFLLHLGHGSGGLSLLFQHGAAAAAAPAARPAAVEPP